METFLVSEASSSNYAFSLEAGVEGASSPFPTSEVPFMYPPDFIFCQLCEAGEKTCEHIFLHCPFARCVWCQAPWPLDVQTFPSISIAEWIRKVINPIEIFNINPMDKHAFILYAAIAMNSLWYRLIQTNCSFEFRRATGSILWPGQRKRSRISKSG